jgi:hypothetical protein
MLLFFVMVFSAGDALAATSRSVQITLAKGWNAIHLDVQPADPAVASVFDPAKVDFVARYFTPGSQVRFLENPEEQQWNMPGWGVWYAPDRAEAFLTSLHAVDGGAAYLVHAREACVLDVTGEVRCRRLRWKTDSFNLTGLPVEGTQTPTFAQFFSGAEQKVGVRVYRLVEGAWQNVTDVTTARIRPGEAYWIYCEGNTDYQGPLDVRFSGAEGIDFGPQTHLSNVEITNKTGAPVTVEAALESSTGLPLYRAVPQPGTVTPKTSSLSAAGGVGPIAGGGTERLRLEIRPQFITGSEASGILKLSTSDGLVFRIPVRALAP